MSGGAEERRSGAGESPLLGFRGNPIEPADGPEREKLRRGLGAESLLRVRFIDELPVIETERMILMIAMSDHVGQIVRYLQRNREHLRPWEPLRDDFYFTDAAWTGAPERDQNEARSKAAYRFRMLLKPLECDNSLPHSPRDDLSSPLLNETGGNRPPAKAAMNCRTLYDALQGEFIGTISIRDINFWPCNHATLGYSLDHSLEGQGLMREGVEAVIRFAFDTLNLRRIEACYMPANLRSERLLTALGFQFEGLLRSSMEVDGVWEDHKLCSLINENWTRK